MNTPTQSSSRTSRGRVFSFSRAGLVPILIADCLYAYFYYAWRFTDGSQGLPPEYTLALLAGVHGLQIFILLLELSVHICQFTWARLSDFGKRKEKTQTKILCLFLGLCIFGWSYSSYLQASDSYIKGSVGTLSGIAQFKLYKHDQSVHYYLERKDPRDGIVVVILCTEGSNRLSQKTYVRCLHQKPGAVIGRPPLRAPGSWTTGPLTKQDEQVLEALKNKGLLP